MTDEGYLRALRKQQRAEAPERKRLQAAYDRAFKKQKLAEAPESNRLRSAYDRALNKQKKAERSKRRARLWRKWMNSNAPIFIVLGLVITSFAGLILVWLTP